MGENRNIQLIILIGIQYENKHSLKIAINLIFFSLYLIFLLIK